VSARERTANPKNNTAGNDLVTYPKDRSAQLQMSNRGRMDRARFISRGVLEGVERENLGERFARAPGGRGLSSSLARLGETRGPYLDPLARRSRRSDMRLWTEEPCLTDLMDLPHGLSLPIRGSSALAYVTTCSVPF
jgi:hypothetical protein